MDTNLFAFYFCSTVWLYLYRENEFIKTTDTLHCKLFIRLLYLQIPICILKQNIQVEKSKYLYNFITTLLLLVWYLLRLDFK